jgi:hypothetical protein
VFPEDFIDSKEVLGNVVRYFASFGEAIRDFTVEEFCQEDERDAGKSYKINDFLKKKITKLQCMLKKEYVNGLEQKMKIYLID